MTTNSHRRLTLDASSGAYLDANVIVRYLSNSPQDMADKATEIIENENQLIVAEHILAESAYVLQSVYQIARADLVDALMEFVQLENIRLAHLEKAIVLQALWYCRNSKRVSFADALLWAEAVSSKDKTIYSFDQRLPKTGITLIDLN